VSYIVINNTLRFSLFIMNKKNNASSHAKKGGANKKMKKYARILDYLEAHHPKVFAIIDSLGMHGNLTPRRGGSITFLIPDAALIKELEKIIESDEPEKATDIISSLILVDLFEKPEDFAAKQDDIPNLLEKKLVVKSVAASKVVVDNGELTLDTKFRPFTRQGNAKRGNMAVWNLKGTIEYEKAPKATMKYLKGAKKGSAQVRGGDEGYSKLQSIKMDIIGEEILALSNDRRSADGGRFCPIMNAVVRLLRVFGDKEDPTFHEEYRRAKCLLTMCPVVDFYYLFCNPLIFSPDRVLAAYKKGLDQDRNVDAYRDFCENFKHPAFNNDPAMLLKADGVEAANVARDRIRNSFMARITRETPGKIHAVYQAVDATNEIDGKGPLYSKGLADIFANNKGLHLLLDEFAHMAYTMVSEEVRFAPNSREKAARLKDALAKLSESYGQFTNPEKKTKLDKPGSYGENIDSTALYQCVVSFWKTWGLHFPCAMQSEFEDRVKLGASESDDPYSKDLIDVDTCISEDLNSYDNCPCTVSDSAIAELRAYMKSHDGKLPSGLD